ncbi:MAG: LysR family transcriptional regulator [Pseudomonadota bacterium]
MFSAKELRYVMLLHEHKNFRKASGFAQVSQPALSGAIARIEKRLGVPLFYRDRQTVTATVFGDLVARRAALVLNEMANLTEHIEQLRDTRTGDVRFGIEPAASDLFLGDALADFTARHPNVFPGFELDYWEPLRPRLLDGDITFFVGIKNPAFEDPDTSSRAFYKQELRFFTRAGHPLQKITSPTYRDLIEWPLISYRTVLAKRQIRSMLTNSAETEKFEHNFPVAVVTNLKALSEVVQNTDYVIMGLKTLYLEEQRQGLVRPVRLADFELNLSLEIVWRTNRILSPAEQEMIVSFESIRDQHLEAARQAGLE